MNKACKQELYQLIENCNNEILLTEVKQLLQSETTQDWWDELTKDDKNLLIESKAQYEKGNFISHD
ncbi:MAG: hypothetical protein H0U39_09045 [Segetibacter sp.]|nr:hypothetical protein [Segetibacter sp.]